MLKLNLGCGPHSLDGWINYDIDSYPGVKQLDLSRGQLPHKSNSVDFIFSQHFHEHLTYERGNALLKECGRVLTPEGVMRISMPDLKFLCEEYLKGNIHYWQPTWCPETPCQMVNQGVTYWEHKFIYDFEEIKKSLLIAGFKSIYLVQWKVSKYLELNNLECRPFTGDLIVEARK